MTQGSIRIDVIKKMNYNYITWFKLCLSLYPLLILTPTPFKVAHFYPVEICKLCRSIPFNSVSPCNTHTEFQAFCYNCDCK